LIYGRRRTGHRRTYTMIRRFYSVIDVLLNQYSIIIEEIQNQTCVPTQVHVEYDGYRRVFNPCVVGVYHPCIKRIIGALRIRAPPRYLNAPKCSSVETGITGDKILNQSLSWSEHTMVPLKISCFHPAVRVRLWPNHNRRCTIVRHAGPRVFVK